MLDRSHFDEETLAAMDDIARLLHIKLSVADMNRTFKNVPELDAVQAKPSAKRVMKATRAAAQDLLAQAFEREPNRFREVHRRQVARLAKATESSARLSNLEYAAFPQIAGKGVFDVRVLRPLRELTERWQATAND